ncbi:MAG: SIR2 family protein [Geodermatophilaceae bacterium]
MPTSGAPSPTRPTPSAYGLASALLAGLPTTKAVTLNYDTLYERASRDAGRELAVLPEETVRPGERWLLKLHGTVDRPSTIVLTREDYLGYRRGREAPSALAKALLLTRHLLFVGFGLADDHFHELMHDVREVRPTERRPGSKLGTALVLQRDPLQERLWAAEINLVPVGGDGVAEQARMLEIFLDCLLAHAESDLQFFLGPRYAHRLTQAEARLRDRLIAFATAASEEERGPPAWQEIERAVRDLGHNAL